MNEKIVTILRTKILLYLNINKYVASPFSNFLVLVLKQSNILNCQAEYPYKNDISVLKFNELHIECPISRCCFQKQEAERFNW